MTAAPEIRTTVAMATNEPPKPTEEQLEQERTAQILAEARTRFILCAEAETHNRAEMLEAFNFYAGQHWTEKERAERKENGNQPSLTIERIKPSVKRVVNHIRKNPIACKVLPRGDGASKWGARAINDVFRYIDEQSSADVHIEGAYEDATICGLGWYRLAVDWEGPRSFNRMILVDGFDSPFRVYRDPEAKKFACSDMRFAFVTADWSQDAYKAKWPKSEVASLNSFTGLGDDIMRHWFPEGQVRVAEYWRVVTKSVPIALLEDNTVVNLSDVPEGATVVQVRESEEKFVQQYFMNGIEILDQAEWECEWIPLIPVIGDRVLVNGRRIMRGMVFDAMDASRLLDYMLSKLALVVGLAPISPLVSPAGAIEGFEKDWEEANRVPKGVLKYNQRDPETNETFNAPQRLSASPEIGALMAGINLAVDNIKAQLDFYDASLGNEGPEISGKAILARQQAADAGHFNYADNLSRAREHEARIKMALIPKVMNRDQVINITDPDGSERKLELMANADGPPLFRIEEVADQIFELDTGKYALDVSSAPRFETRRQESLEFLMELARMFPEMMARALPMLIRTTDAPDADKIANIIDPQGASDQKIPPQITAEMDRRAQLIQMLGKALEQLQATLDSKQMELQSKERIAGAKNRTDMAIATQDNQTKRLIAANENASEEEIALLNARTSRAATVDARQNQPAGLASE